MIEKKVLVKNLRVNYKIIGEGKPMLILHGWGSNSEKWIKVGQILAEKKPSTSLGAGIQIIVPDLPGFGKSQEPTVAWSLDDYVDWLYEFCDAISELKNEFYLLGHSFGGALATKFTIRYNQKVERLFLISAACIRKNTTIKKVFYRISKIIKVFSFLPYYQQFRKSIYKFIIKKSDYLNQEGIMKETYLKVILDDLSYKMSFVKVPTIIIWGEKDTLTPIEYGNFINKKVINSKIIIIPSADHSLHRNAPEVLSEKILENL